jgi:hypothetical protein
MGHDGLMSTNGIQAVISPRVRLAAASARRTARDGRKWVYMYCGSFEVRPAGHSRSRLSKWYKRMFKARINRKATVDDYRARGLFLNLLDKDIVSSPNKLKPFSKAFVHKWSNLVGGIEVDLDLPLVEEDDQVEA